MVLLIRLLTNRSSLIQTCLKRSITIRSNTDIGNQMKSLNDNKQFRKALELFDEQTRNHSNAFSSSMITQALKACTNLKDVKRGLYIYHLVSSTRKIDLYITTSLIHFFSQFSFSNKSLVIY